MVSGSGFLVSGFGISAFGIRNSGFGFRDSGFGIRVSGLRIRNSGLGFWNSGFGIQNSGGPGPSGPPPPPEPASPSPAKVTLFTSAKLAPELVSQLRHIHRLKYSTLLVQQIYSILFRSKLQATCYHIFVGPRLSTFVFPMQKSQGN